MTYKKRIERIVIEMHRQNYNQRQLSEAKGLSRQTLSKAINDRENQVMEETLIQIEKALNILS